MPFWLFLAVEVVGLLALSLGELVVSFVLASKLLGIRTFGWRRSLVAGGAFFVSNLCLLGLIFVVNSSLARAGLAIAGLGFVLALVLLMLKRWGRVSWGRAVAGTVLFLLLHTGVGLGLAYAWTGTVAKSFVASTRSMAPTLQLGDRFIVDRLLSPRRWDVVAFHPPHEPGEVYAKRLIGLPGERVEIVHGAITIDGRVVDPPAELAWLRYDGTRRGSPPICRGAEGTPMKLGPGECYVLGDNTQESLDSRYFPAVAGVQAGAVPMRAMVGVVRATYAPVGRIRMFR